MHPSLPNGASTGGSSAPARAWRNLDGRWVAAAIIAAFAGGLAWAMLAGDPKRIWYDVGVFPLKHHFADLYLFVAAQETLASSKNIYTNMAAEPWGRSYNYPVLWLTFMRFSAAAIPYLGAGMIVAWFAALSTACGRLSVRQGWIVGILSCSPPVVLALERGNTDVVIFCLIVASIAMLGRGRTAIAWTGLTVATTLKLFPLFAFGSFVRLGWRRARPWLVAAAVATVILSAIQFKEIQAVLRETPKGGMFSYGAGIWIQVANAMLYDRTGIVGAFDAYRLPSMLCAAMLVATAFVAGARHPPISREPDRPDVALDYFRTGASVFVATFLLGGHYVYRLIFLLLCVPWLTRESESNGSAFVWGQRVCLTLLAVGLWSNPYWASQWYYVREFATWSLAGVLAWMMGRMLPSGFPGERWRRGRSAVGAGVGVPSSPAMP